VLFKQTMRNFRNERELGAGMGRIHQWIAGMQTVDGQTLGAMFPVDIERKISLSEIKHDIDSVGREVVALDNLAAAYAYQGKKGTDVGVYASMIKGDWDRVFPQAIDYGSIASAKGTELPVEQIGTVEERLGAIIQNVVPDYFKEVGKTDVEIAQEIEEKRMGVMTDQSLREWVEVARGSMVAYGAIFTQPMYSEMLEDITDEVALKIGFKFGYKANEMGNKYSDAFQDCVVASRRALMLFRQLDLDMQFCADGNSNDTSEVTVELIHNDAGKMGYLMMRLWGQSADKDYPFNVGIGRSIQNATHNLVQAAPMVISLTREFDKVVDGQVVMEKGKSKKDKDMLSMWQLIDGINEQKGLRLDQLPLGNLNPSKVVYDYFNAAKGEQNNAKIKGFPNDIFNIPYCLMLNYAYKYFSLLTENSLDSIKKLSMPSEMADLNKAMETYLMIGFGTEIAGLGGDAKKILGKVCQLDKCNLLIATFVALAEPLPGKRVVQQAPLVDDKNMIKMLGLEKLSTLKDLIAYGKNSGFLTNITMKGRTPGSDGTFNYSENDSDIVEIRKKQTQEGYIIGKGTGRRMGVTIEESGLFTKDEINILRKSQLFSLSNTA